MNDSENYYNEDENHSNSDENNKHQFNLDFNEDFSNNVLLNQPTTSKSINDPEQYNITNTTFGISWFI
jgi:hypothetical protein